MIWRQLNRGTALWLGGPPILAALAIVVCLWIRLDSRVDFALETSEAEIEFADAVDFDLPQGTFIELDGVERLVLPPTAALWRAQRAAAVSDRPDPCAVVSPPILPGNQLPVQIPTRATIQVERLQGPLDLALPMLSTGSGRLHLVASDEVAAGVSIHQLRVNEVRPVWTVRLTALTPALMTILDGAATAVLPGVGEASPGYCLNLAGTQGMEASIANGSVAVLGRSRTDAGPQIDQLLVGLAVPLQAAPTFERRPPGTPGITSAILGGLVTWRGQEYPLNPRDAMLVEGFQDGRLRRLELGTQPARLALAGEVVGRRFYVGHDWLTLSLYDYLIDNSPFATVAAGALFVMGWAWKVRDLVIKSRQEPIQRN